MGSRQCESSSRHCCACFAMLAVRPFVANKRSVVYLLNGNTYYHLKPAVSQRSLQDAPIFRLLLKVAVKGTHQCDYSNFWGSSRLPTSPVDITSHDARRRQARARVSAHVVRVRLCPQHCAFAIKTLVSVCIIAYHGAGAHLRKLTWLVLGEDPAARSHRVEQFTAL